jgi:hypothetical protein
MRCSASIGLLVFSCSPLICNPKSVDYRLLIRYRAYLNTQYSGNMLAQKGLCSPTSSCIIRS